MLRYYVYEQELQQKEREFVRKAFSANVRVEGHRQLDAFADSYVERGAKERQEKVNAAIRSSKELFEPRPRVGRVRVVPVGTSTRKSVPRGDGSSGSA